MILGFDASNNNGQINWSAVPSLYKFAWVKATQGTRFTDRFYADNIAGARRHGLYVGGYHFLDTSAPTAQAHHFAQTIGRPGRGYLPPIADFEGAIIGDGQRVQKLRTFLHTVDTLTGRTCGIYLSDSVPTELGSDWADLSAGRLVWIARYGAAPTHHCDVWQSEEYGTVPGVGSGGVDIDQFNGTVGDLARWAMDLARPEPPGGTPAWYRRVLTDLGKGKWLVGPDVAHVQAVVGVPVANRDGVYGSGTAAAVKAWQARHGLAADGAVGPQTAKAIG